MIKKNPVVRLTINYEDFGLDEENTKPYWALFGSGPDMDFEKSLITEYRQEYVCLYVQGIQITNCPFCFSTLPEVVRNRRIKKIMKITDGGYYCDTCVERANCCECWMPEAAFKIK
jgi:hypothetical protein